MSPEKAIKTGRFAVADAVRLAAMRARAKRDSEGSLV
jgi:hypothetical protein